MEKLIKSTMGVIQEYFLPHVPLKQIDLFKFGLTTLSLSRFDSLNANARIWGGYDIRSSAESRMYRLSNNEPIRAAFFSIVKALRIVTEDSKVNIDFSTFATRHPHAEFQVLAFGVQTFLGRAIPIFFDVIQYPITEGSQNIFIIETIKKLKTILGFYPRFVLDRGFAIPSLIQFFIEEGIIFYVRSKKGKTVTILSMKDIKDMEELDKLVPAGKIKEKDVMVKVYGKPMRLVISDKGEKNKEPWYILTNDMTSSRKEIIETYYHRFEIEETFKDVKHVKGLEVLQVAKVTTFKTLMWFIIAGCWLAYLVEVGAKKSAETAGIIVSKTVRRVKLNKHKTLSLFRSFFEKIQRCFYFVYHALTKKSGFG